ncbi:hypothetical protein NNJEOMEG_02188 [Fundidesulfovibrio magnetotacticus]|uniref:Potassium channel domain-containing protein n=1 Tax=Fundidesulfovibrio magnetotacticus TaxID=2730080 RepID=A0A6V8LRJ9_9BACT|nr:potassium channel family protein [Fundidesulfovibrio magnetotacticus]GFK94344.1 hypothetical protein NNJEOMEG_02188 [Fundidesulfovibrio magnetotacticus]
MQRKRLIIYGSCFLLALLTGTVGFHLIEGLSLFDALYFTVITMGTVGYGDIHPWSTEGKTLAMVLVFAGVGTFVAVAESVAESVFAGKEEQTKREKRNMIRGIFFSDVGLELLTRLVRADRDTAGLSEGLRVDATWEPSRFRQASKLLEGHDFALDPHRLDMNALRALLAEKSDLLLRLLENPSIGEHEAFSDTLRAIYHLRDELMCRPPDLDSLPESDLRHLAGDASRVYGLISAQWITYTGYLKASYPYLFYLAARTNPFNPEASVIVRG